MDDLSYMFFSVVPRFQDHESVLNLSQTLSNLVHRRKPFFMRNAKNESSLYNFNDFKYKIIHLW